MNGAWIVILWAAALVAADCEATLSTLERCRSFAIHHFYKREQSMASYMFLCLEMLHARQPLVFGCGLDSAFYLQLNPRTIFVENVASWVDVANLSCTKCVIPVRYTTVIEEGVVLADDDIPLLDVPELRGLAFDFILIDAPHGRKAGQPGRYQPVKFAAQQRALGHLQHVCLHDLQRPLEKALFERYFGVPDDVLANGEGMQMLGCTRFRAEEPPPLVTKLVNRKKL